MLNMDLKIEDIDKDGDGDVDFSEFQKWWGGNKTRAQVMMSLTHTRGAHWLEFVEPPSLFRRKCAA
eukprot:SAG22_NODE_8922_length_621_cov_0.821839_2_plen_66_part_00